MGFHIKFTTEGGIRLKRICRRFYLYPNKIMQVLLKRKICHTTNGFSVLLEK